MGDLVKLAMLAVVAAGAVFVWLFAVRLFRLLRVRLEDRHRRVQTAQSRAVVKERESRVFRLAASHGGAVTAYQAARATDMTLEEATAFLDELVKAGAAEMVVRESGTIEYRFPQE